MAIHNEQLNESLGDLHQAVQLIASTGISYIDTAPDDSHTNMSWSNRFRGFLGHSFGPRKSLQVGICIPALELMILKSDELINSRPLVGITLEEAGGWLAAELVKHGLDASHFTLKRHYELPEYPDRTVTRFPNPDEDALNAYADLYDLAHHSLSELMQNEINASDPVCWPHHFDLATLVSLPAEDGSAESRSIGLGFSPGDGSYAQPYFYVSPWPYPDLEKVSLPDLDVGHWHTEQWTGAVLSFEDFKGRENEVVAGFLQNAYQHSKALLMSTT